MTAVRYRNRPMLGLQDNTAATAAGSSVEVAGAQQQQQQGVRGTAGLDMPIAEATEGDEVSTADAAGDSDAAAATVAAASEAATQAMMLAGLHMSETKPAIAADETKAADVTAPTAVVIAVAEEPKTKCCWPIMRRQPTAKPPKPQDNKSHWYDWMVSNAEGLGRNAKGSKLDAWWMLVSLGISLSAVIAGLYQIAARGDRYDFGSVTGLKEVRIAILQVAFYSLVVAAVEACCWNQMSWMACRTVGNATIMLVFLQVFSTGQLHEFMLLALLIAGINAISPLLFFIYFCTKGRVLKVATYTGQTANFVLFVGEFVVAQHIGIATSHSLIRAQHMHNQAVFYSAYMCCGWVACMQCTVILLDTRLVSALQLA